MRGWRLITLTLALAAVAGCIGADEAGLEEQSVGELDPAAIDAPSEAEVVPIEEGLRLVFEDLELPLEQEIEIPDGVAMVRLEAASDQGPVYPYLVEAESEAARCYPSFAHAWNVGVDGTTRCTGLTAVDGDGATWEARVYGSPAYDFLVQAFGVGVGGEIESALAETIHVDLLEEAPGGLTEDLDLDQLSQAHHETGETSYHEVASHDGAELFVEVTLPADDDHGEYPTVLVSSPYTYGARQAGERPYDALVEDFVSRGYAVVVADVRGFARSDGCLEVWGPNEQADQAELVGWITDQDWSDGKVGMTGVSYVGTTPVEAAVQAPEGLEAIVSVAGVINAYKDWHFGGVPNGESIGSPTFYQVLGLDTTSSDPIEQAADTANGVCDPTLVQRANDPRAIYDEFFEVRNFTQRADEVEAAVLVEHGYNDPNVKSNMQVDWFNDLDVPKLGLFGHWSHQLASRADEATLQLAWMDQFLKGQEIGLGNVSKASISANGDRYREADAWPDPAAEARVLHADFEEGTLGEPADGQAEILLGGLAETQSLADAAPGADTAVGLSHTFEQPLSLTGHAYLHLSASLQGAENAYVAAQLYHVQDEGPDELVTFGWVNLAHRDDHTSWDPIQPAERVDVRLPFLPTERVFEEGEEVRIEIRGVTDAHWGKYRPGKVGQLVLHGGEDGTALALDTLPEDTWQPTPPSVATVPAE